jgi:hypothetical protein
MYVDLRAVISSLSCIIPLDFVTEKERVYSALRIEYFIQCCNNVSLTAATVTFPSPAGAPQYGKISQYTKFSLMKMHNGIHQLRFPRYLRKGSPGTITGVLYKYIHTYTRAHTHTHTHTHARAHFSCLHANYIYHYENIKIHTHFSVFHRNN